MSTLATVIRNPALGRTELTALGVTRRVRRAWPGDPGELLVELDDGGSALGGAVDKDGRLWPYGNDPALPTLASWRAQQGAVVVAHRPGRRAVLRVAATTAAPVRFVKLDRPARRQRALERLRLVDAALADRPQAPRRPRARAVEDDPGALELAEVSGSSFASVLREAPVPQVRRAAGAIGRALAAMAAVHPVGLPEHGIDEEIEAMAGWVERAVQHGAVTGAAAAALRRRADDAAAGLRRCAASAPPAALTHRDLHDGQLVLDPGGTVTLLDWDTASVGPPALDLGNLLAHVDRVVPLRPRAAAVAVEALIGATMAGPIGAHGAEPVAAWREAAAVRIAAVHAFRPHGDVGQVGVSWARRPSGVSWGVWQAY